MPRASLRSVLLICAFNTACMCRVSTQITGNPASARALNSHCASGPASNPIPLHCEAGGILQHRQQRFRFARHLYFPNDLACVIHNADARLLDRNVQSSKMVHAALLLLMLEAVDPGPRFTIRLRAAPKIFSYPQAAGRLPHLLADFVAEIGDHNSE